MNYESIHKAARKSAEEFEYSERQKASKLDCTENQALLKSAIILMARLSGNHSI